MYNSLNKINQVFEKSLMTIIQSFVLHNKGSSELWSVLVNQLLKKYEKFSQQSQIIILQVLSKEIKIFNEELYIKCYNYVVQNYQNLQIKQLNMIFLSWAKVKEKLTSFDEHKISKIIDSILNELTINKESLPTIELAQFCWSIGKSGKQISEENLNLVYSLLEKKINEFSVIDITQLIQSMKIINLQKFFPLILSLIKVNIKNFNENAFISTFSLLNVLPQETTDLILKQLEKMLNTFDKRQITHLFIQFQNNINKFSIEESLKFEKMSYSMIKQMYEINANVNFIVKMHAHLNHSRYPKLLDMLENQILSQLKNNEKPGNKLSVDNFNKQELKEFILKMSEKNANTKEYNNQSNE